jgi:hypothetical protein
MWGHSQTLDDFLRLWSRYVITPCASGLIGLSVVLSIVTNLNYPWTSLRLAPSFALARGYPLYSLSDQPPWVTVGYGPFYPLAYLPCIFAKNPVTAVCAATILAYAYVLLPVGLLSALFCRRVVTLPNGAKPSWVPVFLFFGLLAISVPSLDYITTKVHVDAPTLGFFLMGCYFVLRAEEVSRSGRFTAVAGVFAGLSASCKFTLLAGVFALALFVLWSLGWKRAIAFVLSAVLTVCLVYGWIIARDGFPAILLNFQVLGRFPWVMVDQAGLEVTTIRSSDKILIFLAWILTYLRGYGSLILATLALTWLAHFRAAPHKMPPANRLVWLFLFTALVVMPASVASRGKLGGDVNSLAIFTLPLILAAVFAFWAAIYRANSVGRLAAYLALTGTILFVGLLTEIDLQRLNFGRSLMEESYATVRAHPSQCYFPYDPLAHLLAGDRFRPNMDVIWSYAMGGFPVDRAAFAASMPEGMKYVIFPSPVHMNNWGSSELSRLLPVLKVPIRPLDLEQHEVWGLQLGVTKVPGSGLDISGRNCRHPKLPAELRPKNLGGDHWPEELPGFLRSTIRLPVTAKSIFSRFGVLEKRASCEKSVLLIDRLSTETSLWRAW